MGEDIILLTGNGRLHVIDHAERRLLCSHYVGNEPRARPTYSDAMTLVSSGSGLQAFRHAASVLERSDDRPASEAKEPLLPCTSTRDIV